MSPDLLVAAHAGEIASLVAYLVRVGAPDVREWVAIIRPNVQADLMRRSAAAFELGYARFVFTGPACRLDEDLVKPLLDKPTTPGHCTAFVRDDEGKWLRRELPV